MRPADENDCPHAGARPDDNEAARGAGRKAPHDPARCDTCCGKGLGEACRASDDPALTRLSDLRPGQSGRVCSASLGCDEAAQLGAMGVCRDALVRLCRTGQPCIISVGCGCRGSCRIGLARPLADRIMVRLV